MPSKAFDNTLHAVLSDAQELVDAHASLKTGQPGRQWGLGALNRVAVAMCVAAWEAYVEELVRECLEALRPPAGGPLGVWPALNASVRSDLGRFNTPNSQNVRTLFSDGLGLTNITAAWTWTNASPESNARKLDAILKTRHLVAHGASPRPTVHNKEVQWIIFFVRRLAQCTDNAALEHLTVTLGINPGPWTRHP